MAPFFYMTTPTTIDTETELSAVNSILGSIGQSPITTLDFTNPEVAFVYNLLKEANVDTQGEGWHYNTELAYEFKPDANKNIIVPGNVLRLDVTGGYVSRFQDVVKRDGKLYDKIKHSYEFDGPLSCDVVWLFNFEDLPNVFKRYITLRAAGRAATQLVANADLVKLLGQSEEAARAAIVEYECNQGNHNYLGFPANTSYQTYTPFSALRR